jgi:hypothetical protein
MLRLAALAEIIASQGMGRPAQRPPDPLRAAPPRPPRPTSAGRSGRRPGTVSEPSGGSTTAGSAEATMVAVPVIDTAALRPDAAQVALVAGLVPRSSSEARSNCAPICVSHCRLWPPPCGPWSDRGEPGVSMTAGSTSTLGRGRREGPGGSEALEPCTPAFHCVEWRRNQVPHMAPEA